MDGKQERELAIERADYHEGIPAIVDSGWSKRTHCHFYNAKSGVGIIIGLSTKKLFHLSVQNKYCTACAMGKPQDQHHCFKNWDSSSSAMETDSILEGFHESERVHGVRYTRFIGDAVYANLLQGVPGWGRAIKKLECANHVCKCYRSNLEVDHPDYSGGSYLIQSLPCLVTLLPLPFLHPSDFLGNLFCLLVCVFFWQCYRSCCIDF